MCRYCSKVVKASSQYKWNRDNRIKIYKNNRLVIMSQHKFEIRPEYNFECDGLTQILRFKNAFEKFAVDL